MRVILALFASLLFLAAPLSAQERARAILVLDASGSMWGQIDGIAKITIAQEVVGELLQSLPPEQELGLTVYGHRRKGDCGDIETVILPGGDQRAAIADAVNAIKPKGKTPLSAAVIAAAEALRYSEEKATVILVSDGKETCDFDPCEVGRRLEETGIDFTAHVIGFDISDPADRAELQCLAEETGGTFRTASNGAELAQALTVVAEPDPEYSLAFIATEGEGGPVITTGLTWSLGQTENGPWLAENQPGSSIGHDQLPPGPLFVSVTRDKDGASVSKALVVDDTTPGTITLVLPELPPEPQTLTAIAREQGSNAVIQTPLNWTVAGEDGAKLIDNELTAGPQLSVLPGQYQITVTRPEDGASASLRVNVKDRPLQAVLKLPEIIRPAPLKMNAREKGVNGMIGRNLVWTLYDRDGNVVLDHVNAPVANTEVMPGRYRVEVLRPEDEHTEELEFAAKRSGTTVTVTFPPYLPAATIDAPDSAPVGTQVLVDWTGPNEENDYLAVAETGSKDSQYKAYEYTRQGPTLSLTMPSQPGTYELRYILNDGRKALVRRAIEVTAVEATLDAPATATAGSDLAVTWTGPDYANDYIDVAAPGEKSNKYINYGYTREGSPVTVQMPLDPGIYELRYIMSQDRTILVTRRIEVTGVDATLSAPDAAAAGSTIVVDWTGPDYQNDYLAVAVPDAPGNKYVNYTYTREGSPLQLQMPVEPGQYELRYIASQDRRVLARRPIEIGALETALSAPDSAPAGSTIIVDWQGPDYQSDYIAAAEAGSRDDKYATYTYTREGNPLQLQLPLTPGEYELRYVISQDRTVATRRAIRIEPVAATLDAPATAPAGGMLSVGWEGPDYRNDFVSIAEVGTKDDKYKTYTYTRDGSPLRVQVPSEPGKYELRYVAAGSPRTVLARQALEVAAVTASVQAETSAAPGSNLVVTWEGPDNPRDYIALSKKGDKGYVTYVYTSEGSPLILKVPDAAGDYEVRYVLRHENKVIARSGLKVE